MKNYLLILSVVGLALNVTAADPATPKKSTEENPHIVSKESMSYALGVDLARNFKREEVEVDASQFAKGMRDAFAGEKLEMNEVEIKACLNSLQSQIRQKQAATRGMKPAEITRRRGEDFLAENHGKPGVHVLTNGVQYQVIKAGSGKKPLATDLVECAYRLTLMDGTQVAGTGEGKPDAFKVNAAPISGWQHILTEMPVGSKWRVFVPSSLAYGVQGIPGRVSPNEVIVSDLELLQIK